MQILMERRNFAFVIFGQKKKAYEAHIQCKRNAINKTDCFAYKHAVALAARETISYNFQLQNGAPQCRYTLCEVIFI